MNNRLKIALCIGVFALLTACGGDSKGGGGESSFVGNWKTQCYSGQKLRDIFDRMGINASSSVKGLVLQEKNTADKRTTNGFSYSDTSCSKLFRETSMTCSYTNQGQKTASDGKTVQKISGRCPQGAFRDVYLVENGNLYISVGGDRDDDGYPNQVIYDYYYTKQ